MFDRTVDRIVGRDPVNFTPSDFNKDGNFDQLDLEILTSNFNQKSPLPDSVTKGDVDLNGRVDLRDFIESRVLFPAGGIHM